MTTTLTKTLKVLVVVAVAALSAACSQTTSYGVADYSYHGVGSYASPSTVGTAGADVFSEF